MREVNERTFAVLGLPVAAVEDVQFTFDLAVADPVQLEAELRAMFDGPVGVYGTGDGYRVIVPKDLTPEQEKAIAEVVTAHRPAPRFVLSPEEKMGAMELATNPSIDAQKLQDAARMLSAALLRAQRIEAQGGTTT